MSALPAETRMATPFFVICSARRGRTKKVTLRPACTVAGDQNNRRQRPHQLRVSASEFSHDTLGSRPPLSARLHSANPRNRIDEYIAIYWAIRRSLNGDGVSFRRALPQHPAPSDVHGTPRSVHTMRNQLDNPVWHALTGPHACFAKGQGQARHYPRDVAPFSGIAEPTAAAYADLAADLPSQTAARLFRPEYEPVPPGWDTISAKPIVQMICDGSEILRSADPDPRIIPLGSTDVSEMLALVEAAKPGPFGSRTIELGTYVGVRHSRTGQLIAMGGERFRVDGHVELSAIAVHPDARGLGLGAVITAHLARAAIVRGETPFLHVFPDNPALRLYIRLGFRERTRLWVICRRLSAGVP